MMEQWIEIRNGTAWYGVEWTDDGIDEWPLRPPTARGPNEWHSGLSGESRYSDYPPMSSLNHLLKSNRLRNFHILRRGSKKRNVQCFTKLPLDQTFSPFFFFRPFTSQLPKCMNWNVLSWEQRMMKLIAWLTAICRWFNKSAQNIPSCRLEQRCKVAFTGPSMIKYLSYAILLTVRLFRHFPGILEFLERPVKRKYESVPWIDNSDSSDRVIENYWSIKVKNICGNKHFNLFIEVANDNLSRHVCMNTKRSRSLKDISSFTRDPLADNTYIKIW